LYPDRHTIYVTDFCYGTKCTAFCFYHTAPTEFSTLSLHDALPISIGGAHLLSQGVAARQGRSEASQAAGTHETNADLARTSNDPDRKSTRLNSSHVATSYAVFCLKKKMAPPLASTQ